MHGGQERPCSNAWCLQNQWPWGPLPGNSGLRPRSSAKIHPTAKKIMPGHSGEREGTAINTLLCQRAHAANVLQSGGGLPPPARPQQAHKCMHRRFPTPLGPTTQRTCAALLTRPHVDGGAVVAAGQQQLGGAIPAGHHILRHQLLVVHLGPRLQAGHKFAVQCRQSGRKAGRQAGTLQCRQVAGSAGRHTFHCQQGLQRLP